MNLKIMLFISFFLVVLVTFGLVDYTYLSERFVQITGGKVGLKYYGLDENPLDNIRTEVVMEFDLRDPESAPEDKLNKILYGYQIMLETQKNAADYCGNSIACKSCHFVAGNTLGGKNRGISLVGVTAMYPKYSKRDKKNISLSDRICNCFQRSLNGKPPPKDSLQMEALLAYLAWISDEVLNAPALPWLGLDPISSKHVPDPINGAAVYDAQCSLCHGYEGKGNVNTPALWGDFSFNDGAGMNTMPMLSSFVLQNMPFGQPDLTPEEALDVSSYIISKPRPHFVP